MTLPRADQLSEMEKRKEELKSGASDPAVPNQSALPVQFIKYTDLLLLPGKARKAKSSYWRSSSRSMLEDTDYMVTLDTELGGM